MTEEEHAVFRAEHNGHHVLVAVRSHADLMAAVERIMQHSIAKKSAFVYKSADGYIQASSRGRIYLYHSSGGAFEQLRGMEFHFAAVAPDVDLGVLDEIRVRVRLSGSQDARN